MWLPCLRSSTATPAGKDKGKELSPGITCCPGLLLFSFPARVYECMRSCMLSPHAACAPGMSPSRAGDPAASWGIPFAMGVSLQFMTKQEQPQSPCAIEASPASEQQSRGLQRAGWTQLWMCVNVSGFVPVQRGPEQCLCIAVPTELGPSRTLSPAPEPAQMPTAQKVPSFTQEKRC